MVSKSKNTLLVKMEHVKDILTHCGSLNKNLKISFKRDGISCTVIDDAHVSMSTLKIKTSNNIETDLYVTSDNLSDIVKKFKNTSSKLEFILDGPTVTVKSGRYRMKFIELENNAVMTPNRPELDYDDRMILHGKANSLRADIKTLSHEKSDCIRFSLSDGKMTIMEESMNTEQVGSEFFVDNEEYDIIKNTKITAMFPADYIHMIYTNINKESEMAIYLKTDNPLLIRWILGDKEGEYLLAPRIEG